MLINKCFLSVSTVFKIELFLLDISYICSIFDTNLSTLFFKPFQWILFIGFPQKCAYMIIRIQTEISIIIIEWSSETIAYVSHRHWFMIKGTALIINLMINHSLILFHNDRIHNILKNNVFWMTGLIWVFDSMSLEFSY